MRIFARALLAGPRLNLLGATFRLLPFWFGFDVKYLTKLSYNLLQANANTKFDDMLAAIPLQMHYPYKGTCEPHNNRATCDYDYGDCCQPGTVCRNKMMYFTVVNLWQEEVPKFCMCAASNDYSLSRKDAILRDGYMGPPIYSKA